MSLTLLHSERQKFIAFPSAIGLNCHGDRARSQGDLVFKEQDLRYNGKIKVNESVYHMTHYTNYHGNIKLTPIIVLLPWK